MSFRDLHRAYAVDQRWRATLRVDDHSLDFRPGQKSRSEAADHPPHPRGERKKRGPYGPVAGVDGRRWAWTPERRARHSEKMKEVNARPEIREARRQGALRAWRRGRHEAVRIPVDIIPVWIKGKQMKREFVDALIEGGEIAAAAHCRRLLAMEREDADR